MGMIENHSARSAAAVIGCWDAVLFRQIPPTSGTVDGTFLKMTSEHCENYDKNELQADRDISNLKYYMGVSESRNRMHPTLYLLDCRAHRLTRSQSGKCPFINLTALLAELHNLFHQ
jgi:hypothetical protein